MTSNYTFGNQKEGGAIIGTNTVSLGPRGHNWRLYGIYFRTGFKSEIPNDSQ